MKWYWTGYELHAWLARVQPAVCEMQRIICVKNGHVMSDMVVSWGWYSARTKSAFPGLVAQMVCTISFLYDYVVRRVYMLFILVWRRKNPLPAWVCSSAHCAVWVAPCVSLGFCLTLFSTWVQGRPARPWVRGVIVVVADGGSHLCDTPSKHDSSTMMQKVDLRHYCSQCVDISPGSTFKNVAGNLTLLSSICITF